MKKSSPRTVKALLFVTLSMVPVIVPTIALAQTGQTNDDDKGVKQDAKDAGHSTKEATKKTGSNIKKGTKHVVNKSASKTAEGSDKVADKTKP
jgi:hypothetical protein